MLFCQAQVDLWHKLYMLSSQTDVINDNKKPVVETIMNKGMTVQGMYEKARVAKGAAKYGVLCIAWHFAKTWLMVLLKKELFEVGRVGLIVKFQL